MVKATERKSNAKSTGAKKSESAVAKKTVLILRTCKPDMTSHAGFRWPESGPVEAKDWKRTEACGNGLHGWLWGAGDWSLKQGGDGIKWLVVEVVEADLIDLGGKVKFPRGNVLQTYGHWHEAMAFIRARLLESVKTQATASGRKECASATGYSGHASATGYSGHASATGNSGHASATGDYGHASATGDYGHASATGSSGHASATGDYGHASATGSSGWAAAGYSGRAKAAENGVLSILWWDEKSNRPRLAIGYVGEDGIKADTFYVVRDGALVELEVSK
jgi:hypothetical protein